jgi:hypothetical protein
MVKVIGIQFEGYNKLGDFNYMCELEEYKDTLFIFNDNEEYHNTCKKEQEMQLCVNIINIIQN